MINYFKAAERTLSNRGTLERALENLKRRRAGHTERGPAGITVDGLLPPLCVRGRSKRRPLGLPRAGRDRAGDRHHPGDRGGDRPRPRPARQGGRDPPPGVVYRGPAERGDRGLSRLLLPRLGVRPPKQGRLCLCALVLWGRSPVLHLTRPGRLKKVYTDKTVFPWYSDSVKEGGDNPSPSVLHGRGLAFLRGLVRDRAGRLFRARSEVEL